MFFNNKSTNTIVVNGKSITVQGNNISVINNRVYVDGKEVETGELKGTVHIEFKGDLAKLKTDSSATIHGNVKGNVDSGTSVKCGDVGGSVDAGTSVSCGNVQGDVDAGTSIKMKR